MIFSHSVPPIPSTHRTPEHSTGPRRLCSRGTRTHRRGRLGGLGPKLRSKHRGTEWSSRNWAPNWEGLQNHAKIDPQISKSHLEVAPTAPFFWATGVIYLGSHPKEHRSDSKPHTWDQPIGKESTNWMAERTPLDWVGAEFAYGLRGAQRAKATVGCILRSACICGVRDAGGGVSRRR